MGLVSKGSSAGDAGFCGPCVCSCVFLLLSCRMLVSGIAGGWGCVKFYSRLVSRW
jgi:hypothetical protein